jgi:glycerol-3-phosphate acyltransferase PlsY
MIFYISILAISYLSGAIPFGLLIAKQRGVDVRAKGSGNIGATNVLRSVGKVEGALTLLADMLKGTIPAVVAYAVTGDSGIAAAAGTVAVFGHVFPVFLKFKGGKGVATALGVLAYITPKAALGGVLVFATATFLSKYVSLGSLSAAVAIPLLAAFFHYEQYSVAASILISLLVIVRHHANIRRLIKGTENKV